MTEIKNQLSEISEPDKQEIARLSNQSSSTSYEVWGGLHNERGSIYKLMKRAFDTDIKFLNSVKFVFASPEISDDWWTGLYFYAVHFDDADFCDYCKSRIKSFGSRQLDIGHFWETVFKKKRTNIFELACSKWDLKNCGGGYGVQVAASFGDEKSIKRLLDAGVYPSIVVFFVVDMHTRNRDKLLPLLISYLSKDDILSMLAQLKRGNQCQHKNLVQVLEKSLKD
jgi:hypothetical protein